MICLRTLCLAGLACLGAAVPASAQLGSEIARKYAERAGGHLAELKSLRTEGRTFINGEIVPFFTVAERPNRLRVESFTPLRRVVQAYDGVNTPWFSHTQARAGKPQDMPAKAAQEFIDSADFDGPLVNHAEKGYTVDYAGEEAVDGRRAAKLLVMGRRDDLSFLWVDLETNAIVKRTVYQSDQAGQRATVETFFKDFRLVGGVPQPHRIETMNNGQLVYAMLIDRMEANPIIAPGTFARP